MKTCWPALIIQSTSSHVNRTDANLEAGNAPDRFTKENYEWFNRREQILCLLSSIKRFIEDKGDDFIDSLVGNYSNLPNWVCCQGFS